MNSPWTKERIRVHVSARTKFRPSSMPIQGLGIVALKDRVSPSRSGIPNENAQQAGSPWGLNSRGTLRLQADLDPFESPEEGPLSGKES